MCHQQIGNRLDFIYNAFVCLKDVFIWNNLEMSNHN